MKPLMQRMPCLGPVEKKPFRMADLMKEGPRRLRDDELKGAFSAFSSLSAEDRYVRFMAARAAVQASGGSVDIVRQAHDGLRLKARLEFPTSDKTLNPELHALVAGMGFDLSLESKPGSGPVRGMERRYAVTEKMGSDSLDYVHVRAEDLVRLESLLDGQVRGSSMGKLMPFPARAAAMPEARSDDHGQMAALQATR